MPKTIDEGFREFLKKLTPSSYESQQAKQHRASIEACLRNRFTLSRFFRTGSFGNGTSISGYSDVDYFASLGGVPSNSATLLTNVRNALDSRFPRTGVRVTCPSVYVPFGSHARDSTEVVPADLVGATQSGHDIYDISDCSSGWKRSSPEAHNAWVKSVDSKLANKVRPLVRFVKAWKFFQKAPISSFYLELFVTHYASTESTIIYTIDIKNVLLRLHNDGLPKVQDPLGISGTIYPCNTVAQHSDSKSKLYTAATRATKAREAEEAGDIKGAFDWWDLLYNGQFPGYYY